MIKRGLFITGTDTDVGKTFISGALAALIQERLHQADQDGYYQGRASVQLWKPVQSGVQLGDEQADSFRLRQISGFNQPEESIASITLPEPLAPWIAAKRSGTEISFEGLVQDGYERMETDEFLIVEGAGGLLVPITDSKTMADLIEALELPVIVVARSELGTVNHTLLTLSYLRQQGISVRGVIMNGCQDRNAPHVLENEMMIKHFSGIPVLGRLPWIETNQANTDWIQLVKQYINIDMLVNENGRVEA